MTEQKKPRPTLSPDRESESGALRIYSKAKQVIADEIRFFLHCFLELKVGPTAAAYREWLRKLAEDRCMVAVVGQFHRGKSSLLNALIGREELPAGISPMTSACTRIRFGSDERLFVQYDGTSSAEEVPYARLAEYVTESGNPGNRKNVLAAVLELPLPLLRRGIEFIDTPGFGSVPEASSSLALPSLPPCDAVLFVTDLNGPLSSAETRYLNQFRGHVHKMFFIVNKLDLLNSSEKDLGIERVATALRREAQANDLRVFPVSAGSEWLEKPPNGGTIFAPNGIDRLIDALTAFLAAEKSRTFLVPALDGSLLLLNEGRSCLSDQRTDPAVVSKLDRFKERILRLRARILSNDLPATAEFPPMKVETAGEGLPSQAPEAKEPDLSADLRRRGCPACLHITLALLDDFVQRQYALASDPQAPFDFAVHSGFCPLHTWQLLTVSSPQGMSVGYAALVDKIAGRLAHIAEITSNSGENTSSLVATSRECPACRLLREVERTYIRRLADFLQGETGRTAFRNSFGLCLRHLEMTIGSTPTEELKRFLLLQSAQKLDQIAEDMRNFAIKNDALCRGIQNRDEKEAYLKAVRQIVGERAFCVPWALDTEV